jgi:protein-disulfide isomerase
MKMSPRQRKWLTAAVVLALAALAPLMMLLGKTALHHPGRRALVFDEVLWRAEAGRWDPESDRGLMVPGLLATGRLAAKREDEVRALLGEPDCPPDRGGPFALGPRLAYWVGKVGTAKPKPDEPPPLPGCLYLRLVDGRVVEWRTAPAPQGASGAAADAAEPGAGVVRVGLGTGPVLGRPDAPLAVVEFTDFQCPYCRRHHVRTFPGIRGAFVDTGKVRYVIRDLPLPSHPDAFDAARAARCAADQGRYWQMVDALFANQHDLGRAALLRYGAGLGVEAVRFRTCLDGDRHDAAIRRDAEDARAASLPGTPSFVVGRVVGGMVEGTRLVGAQPFEAFEARIRALLPDGR